MGLREAKLMRLSILTLHWAATHCQKRLGPAGPREPSPQLAVSRSNLTKDPLGACTSFPCPPAELPDTFDFVIVGGGAGGCAMARTLVTKARDPPSVLIIERGPAYDKKMEAGIYWPAVVNEAAVPIRWTNGVWGTVAQGLGGGTGVNGGLWVEETSEFLRETLQAYGPDDVTTIEEAFSELREILATEAEATMLGDVYLHAGEEAGRPQLSPTNNGYSQKLVTHGTWRGFQTFNTHKPPTYKRKSAAFLVRDLIHDGSVALASESLAKKILFEEAAHPPRATGVHVEIKQADGSVVPRDFHANTAVILAAGAVYTPHLLMRSGVGPQDELKKFPHDIDAVLVNEHVGRNFIDRPVTVLSILLKPTSFADSSSGEVPLTMMQTVSTDTSLGLAYEAVGGKGVASQFAITSGALVAPKWRSPIVTKLLEFVFTHIGIAEKLVDNAVQVFALQESPKSRGAVKLDPANLDAPPMVTSSTLYDPADRRRQVVAARQIANLTLQAVWSEYAKDSIIDTGAHSKFIEAVEKLTEPVKSYLDEQGRMVESRAGKNFLRASLRHACSQLRHTPEMKALNEFLAHPSVATVSAHLNLGLLNPCFNLDAFVDELLTPVTNVLRCLKADKSATPFPPGEDLPSNEPLKLNTVALPCPPAEDSLEAWNEWIDRTMTSSYHYFGTAQVGEVLEPQSFLVKGSANLHVSDASVFRDSTRANPQATIMAIGQYAGLKILTHYGLR